MRGDVSSQFLSGLLMASPYARDTVTVEVQGVLVSRPYVSMTLAVMEAFGVKTGNRKFRRFDVYPAHYRGRDFAIEPDASAASYFFALAALTGGTITVEGLGTSSLQGDLAFVDILEHMGCTVKRQPDRTTVTGGPLRAVDVDMNAISDTVMTMAVVALFADGVSRIRNVGHIRHKETDRIAALAAELRKLGARIDELADGLVIEPPASAMLQPARINTYDDHRMAMSFALAGLKFPGVTILDPGCVAKTYPGFWNDLEAVRSSSGAEEPVSDVAAWPSVTRFRCKAGRYGRAHRHRAWSLSRRDTQLQERHIVFEAVLKRPQKSQGGKGVCGHRAVRNPEVVGGGCGERSISSRRDDDLRANSRPVHDHQQGWLVLPFALEHRKTSRAPA